jgi:hypothetical protein
VADGVGRLLLSNPDGVAPGGFQSPPGASGRDRCGLPEVGSDGFRATDGRPRPPELAPAGVTIGLSSAD